MTQLESPPTRGPDAGAPSRTRTAEHETMRHREGAAATAIERQTARMPSDVFLWAAGASIATSLALRLMGDREDAIFIGQWAPTFLILGLYNKLVKLHGHDYAH